jgi:hypothetical protein
MRRSTETLIALQFLTVIVPVTLLLLVVLLAEARRVPASGIRWSAGSHILPRSLARIFHHQFAARLHAHAAHVAWQPHLQALGHGDDQ